MRVLLVLMLVHGLAPDLAEVGEALAHYARTGHVAHTEADHGDLGDQGSEHGCGTTQHNCTCCPTQAMDRPGEVTAAAPEPAAAGSAPPRLLAVAVREPDRPFRPPIS